MARRRKRPPRQSDLDPLSEIAWRATVETPGRTVRALHLTYQPILRLAPRGKKRQTYTLVTKPVEFVVSHATAGFIIATDGRRFARHTLAPAPGYDPAKVLPLVSPQGELF